MKILCCIAGCLLLAGAGHGGFFMAGDDQEDISVVARPPTGERNLHYASNREPLLPSAFARLPIGAITPRGWLRGQLERMASGMIGRLPEVSAFCRFEGNAWASPDGGGHSPWEELPYWLKGFGDLGYVLGDERIIDNARRWIDGILASQDEDGWFGPRRNKEQHDCWPNMVALCCLQSFYEATGDERVLPFMTRYFRWQLGIPRERLLPGSWQKIRGGDNLESVLWLYNRTGDKFLLELADVIHARTAPWSRGIADWHGVNICQGFREPAEFYVQAKDPTLLEAAYGNYRAVMERYGQVPGGMFAADENCRAGYHGPRQAAETCSMVEFMRSFEMLVRICGDPVWADRCEEVAFNSLPAAFTPDLKALHYLTAPNMVQLDGESKSPALQNGGCMLTYTPHRYRCCQHNASHGWPYYAEELWLATPDNGLCASLFAACDVAARVGRDGAEVRVAEETDYPFGDKVGFTVSLPAGAEGPVRFPLYVRVPRWCRGARISVNGRAVCEAPSPLSYVRIDRAWENGDRVDATFPMTVGVARWEQNGGCVSVHRGPLAYSLAIAERWVEHDGSESWQAHEKADTQSTPEWPAWEVFPGSPWNYGLVIDEQEPGSSFEVKSREGPLAGQPFVPEGSPVTLEAKARRIPEWKMQDGLAGAMQPGPVRSEEAIETVTLIPMGCARLRIAAFPVIGEGPGAREWKDLRDPKASHCFYMDSVRALNDGLEPKSSADRDVPRLTWWNHKGTAEWAAYEFAEPRTLRGAAVYWYDDTGAGECRVPASWSLSYLDAESGEWRPIAASAGYGTARDTYNRVGFEPVAARGIRLDVQLQEGYSGGILEWRVEDADRSD